MDHELTLFFKYVGYDTELDGELYIHGVKFQTICSIIKKITPPHPRLSEVHYYIFDIMNKGQMPFRERRDLLKNALSQYLSDGHTNTTFAVIDYQIAHNDEEIYKIYKLLREKKFEGAMIRQLNSPYESKRCSSILKLKDEITEEGIITGVKEGKGLYKGKAIMLVQSKGHELSISMKAGLEDKKNWFEHPETVIGKRLTYAYQEETTDGKPRFPRGVAIRDYE